MKNFTQSWIAKALLSIAGISLIISLVTTTSCFGSIDSIFNGWNASIKCSDGYKQNCLIGYDFKDHSAENGAIILTLLLFIVACVYAKFFRHK